MNEQTLFDDVKIQKFRLDELHPADYNPRVELKPGDKEFEKLKKSIGKFGVVELIVVNTANNNTVVSGHQRLNVLKAMGKKEATCLVVELNEEDERSLNIAMNKINGEWDIPKLATLLEQIKDMGRLADTGFDPEEADIVFSKVHDKKVKEDNFDIDSELKQKTFSKEGDMWLIGKHRVVCGDSTGEEVYTRLMDGQKANMVLTDPPYGVDVEETAGKIKNDNLPDAQFHDFLLSAFRCMRANLDDEGSIYVWHADTKGRIFREAYEEAGFYLSGCCIWKKNALVLGRSPYQWIHEPCLYGWKKGGTHKWFGDRKQVTVWEYDKPKSSPDHPTTKPVALMAYPMKNSTTANGIVLDPFLGSGSTLIACMEMGRVCRGIELDPKFVDVIVKRAIAHNDGKYDDVFVIRDGQKLRFDEVASFEPEEVQGDDE